MIAILIITLALLQVPESVAYRRLTSEQNPEAKKKLMLDFEKKFPASNQLAATYIQLSRVLASQTDFVKANEYAEKAVTAVNRLQKQKPAGVTPDPAWQQWLASLDISAKNNLAWTKQMLDWQQKQIHAAVLGRGRQTPP
jgi:hypothetical protein